MTARLCAETLKFHLPCSTAPHPLLHFLPYKETTSPNSSPHRLRVTKDTATTRCVGVKQRERERHG